MNSPGPNYLLKDRRGVTAIVFAISAMAVTMMVGLVIDYSNYMLLRGNLNMAADSGVLAGVTQAATALGAHPTTYLTMGQQAGMVRLSGQAGEASNATRLGQVQPLTANLSVTRSGSVINGSLSWSTAYNPFFASLFGSPAWSMSNVSSSSVQVSTPYLNVYVVLDNSPSMEIGATNSDIQTLQQLTACSASGAYYYNSLTKSWGQLSPASQQSYNAYQCTAYGYSYSGSLTCPIPASSPYTFSTFTPTNNTTGPSCQGYLPTYNGQYPQAGAPCGFACHFDTTHVAGSGTDYYAVARGTIGKSNQVTLRLDVVKAAVNNLIATMKTDAQTFNQTYGQSTGNINVAVYSLASTVLKAYPLLGDAGSDWTAATSAVGGPPTVANGPDTGIQPYAGSDVADTDFPDALTLLASVLTPSGGGTSAADPQKVLVLVTDGVEDYVTTSGTRKLQALEPSYCQLFKNMGYTVFVLYTPYYPLMNSFYLQNMTSVVEGSGASSVTYNMQQCASSSSDYLAATNSTGMNAAL
jgi:Flp pilus assembly protein TadG